MVISILLAGIIATSCAFIIALSITFVGGKIWEPMYAPRLRKAVLTLGCIGTGLLVALLVCVVYAIIAGRMPW